MKFKCLLVQLLLTVCLVCFARSASSACTCQNAELPPPDDIYTCTCSGKEFKEFADLFSDGLCAKGTPMKLTLYNLPNLHKFDNDFVPPPSSGCAGWSSLTALELRNTGLQNFTSSTFRGLYDLKYLDISNNTNIASYQEEVFRTVGSTLIELVATDNRVHSLTRRVFAGLKRVKRLSLSRNKIGYIAPDVFSSGCCSELIELRLDHNFLTDLEDNTFNGLTSLNVLDLRGNPLQRLSPKLFSPFVRTLTHLWMSHDDLTTFGGFAALPKDLFTEMSSLRVLEIAELKLRNLSATTFAGLVSLEELSLRGNRLTLIPSKSLSSLPNLWKIDLSANALLCLPDAASENYTKLRWLDISLNAFTHLTRSAFAGLASAPPTREYPRLVINISANSIQRIEADTFCDLGGPVEIVVGFMNSNARNSWSSMFTWPESPLALIGTDSVISGLSQNGEGEPMMGRPDSAKVCNDPALQSAILSSELYTQSKYTPDAVNTSLTSECPWLPPPKFSEWHLAKLGVPGLSGTPNSISDGNLGNALEQGSRLYLLIIVAVCVTFLLSALTIIMCYRAWSRRATQKLAVDTGDANDLEMANPTDAVLEKQELLERNHIVTANGNRHPAGILSPLSEASESTVANCISQDTNFQENSAASQTPEGETAHETPQDGKQSASRSGRHNSDSKAEDLEKVTAFGVI